MIIKNRKLVPREGMDVSAFNVAEIERMISEIPGYAWEANANEQWEVSDLFDCNDTPNGYRFWHCVDDHFTVAPATNDDEIAELEATIAKASARLAELRK